MSFALSVFDVFAYLLPGGLYVTLGAYLVARLGWFDLAEWVAANVLASLIVGGIVAFLVGHLSYGVGRALDHRLPTRRRRGVAATRDAFLAAVPQAAGRPYLELDPYLLYSRIQLENPDVGLEVARLRSTGLMLRHSAPPLLAGAAVALVEVAAGDHRLPALAAAAVLALAAWGGVARGREVGQWALRKTLEVAFWMDDVDRPAPARPAP